MSRYLLFLVIAIFFFANTFAQQDSVRRQFRNYSKMDSIQLGLSEAVQIKTVDTLTPKLLMPQDSLLQIRILDSLTNNFRLETFSLENHLMFDQGNGEKIAFQKGVGLERKQVWLLTALIVLLVFFAILKNAFGKQLFQIISAFYSNRALANLNKEENMITSWSFLLLFVQFGFTLGLFFYLAANYRFNDTVNIGLKAFLAISGAVIVLYLLKILALRFIGFVFDVQKPLAEYTTILYLSYFNASLLFIPVITAFCLSPIKYSDFYTVLGIIVLAIIFLGQFFRAVFTILSQHRFSKIYLFLYFCTLEICPMLILIKAVGFKL